MTHAHAVLFPKEQAYASQARRICTRGLFYEQKRSAREERKKEDQQGERASVIFQKRRHRRRSGASFSLSFPLPARSSFLSKPELESGDDAVPRQFPLIPSQHFSLHYRQRKEPSTFHEQL